jgi:two-component system chemotaxis response regulator CheB
LYTKKVLVVSPSAVFRLNIKKILDTFDIKIAKNNKDLEKLLKEKFDIVIFDTSFGDEYKKIKYPTILIGKGEIEFEFFDEEFKQKLLDKINEVLEIKIKKTTSFNINPDKIKYVLIGSSTGGPGLIETIAKSLPKDYPWPVCVVQHMPPSFISKFANRLNSISKLNVIEADNSTPVIPGNFIIAKGGWHLHFRKKEVIYCKLVPNAKNRFFTPSVDEMFFSAIEVMNPKNILAVLLTGIGDDGADGMVALKKAGAITIAESEETATVFGMPKEAIARGGATKVLPFPKIVEEIINFGKIN